MPASTLIVEDGSGLLNADAYVSSANCDAYHAAFGNTAWALITDQTIKDAAIRRATQYIDTHYRFVGIRKTYLQVLQWPRSNVWLDSVYTLWPVNRVVQACCELALRAGTGSLQVDQSDQFVKRQKVGELEIEYSGSNNSGQQRFAVVDDLLKPFASSGAGGSLRVERA